MSFIFPTKTVTLEPVIGEWSETAELLDLDLPYGDRWGIATVNLPKRFAGDSDIHTGDFYKLSIGDPASYLFVGCCAEIPDNLDGGNDGLQLVLHDIRWLLARRKIGQRDIGPALGWPEVGRILQFNPHSLRHGKEVPNRSKEVDESGVFTFDSSPDAVIWSHKNVLDFLLKWFAPELTIGAGVFGTKWQDPVKNWTPHGLPTGRALSQLCALAGDAWTAQTKADDASITNFLLISSANTATETFQLPTGDGTAYTDDAVEKSVVDARVRTRITDCCDIVHVVSNRIWKEVTLVSDTVDQSEGLYNVLTQRSDERPGYRIGWQMDVEHYSAAQLGDSLAAGSRPKPWRERLVSLITPAGDGYFAGYNGTNPTAGDYPAMKIGNGKALSMSDCLWLRAWDAAKEGGAGWGDWRRVKSGFLILPDEATVWLEAVMTGADGRNIFAMGGESGAASQLMLTCATLLEDGVEYKSADPTSWHISDQYPLVETLIRTDIKPEQRRNVRLPSLDPATPNAIVNPAVTTDQNYWDVLTDMEDIADRQLAMSEATEVHAQLQLLDVPVLAIGSKVVVSPGSIALTGDEIIIGLRYRFSGGDRVTVLCTNNLRRLIGDDA